MKPLDPQPKEVMISPHQEAYQSMVLSLQDWVSLSENSRGVPTEMNGQVLNLLKPADQIAIRRAEWSSILFACLCLEGFINFVGKFNRVPRLQQLEMLQVHLKFFVYPKMCDCEPLKEQTIADIQKIVKLRNILAHPKPKIIKTSALKAQVSYVTYRCAGDILRIVNDAIHETRRVFGSKIPNCIQTASLSQFAPSNCQSIEGRKIHL